ncbi:MAG: vitamin K epoxide reductase family protein [bacterium]|nr:vitamin K epoxide reductase family protein [bacterium]
MTFYYISILAALGGFFLAFYIHRKKTAHRPLVCPLKSNCDAVIHSRYSKFFGIPVELLGMFYYVLVAASYVIFLKFPELMPSVVVFGVLFMTSAAFVFSLYLTFIQAFVLKQWCTWCLMSAGLCTVIFVSVLSGSGFGPVSLLAEHKVIVMILHVFGVALGLGGATISDLFFFKFLKNFRISEEEADIMHTLSQVIWFALAIIVLSGLGLYFPKAEILNQSPKFLVKMLIVGVIIANGTLLNLLISPRLVKISFAEKHEHQSGKLHHIRRLAFSLGAVSFVSWYSAFILGMLRSVPISFWQLFGLYSLVLALAITGSQIMERVLVRRASKRS